MKKRALHIAATAFLLMLFFPPATRALEVGDQAPAFAVRSNQGEISLADYSGSKHVVLALYFAAFSPV